MSLDTVILTIKQLNETNSVGADGIAYRFMIDGLPVIGCHLMVIVNTSVVTGGFPNLWKYSLVTPVHKAGDIDDVNNFRPISILSIMSKVLEKIVSNQLTDYLEKNNLISNAQHGFRANLSTETALIQITNKIYNNIDNNKITLLTLCDLSKAFDSVNHELLLKKLIAHNIDTFWFSDYLDSRTQSVRIGDHISSALDISFGVPQGSILGPLLFMIFINDLPKVVNDCLVVQFADDTQFAHTGSVNNINELKLRAENTLRTAKKYFDRNGLLVNPKKTQCIFIGSRRNIGNIPENLTINCEGYEIKPSNSVKNLGVIMDRYMMFDKHINEMCKKTMGILIYINRIKHNFDTDARIMVVQSLAISQLNYCSRIWGSANKTQTQRVQKLQNFAAKLASGKGRKFDHATPFISKLGWMKMEQKCDFDICTFMYNIVKGKLPSWLLTVNRVGDVNTRITRQADTLVIPRTNTDTGARNVEVRGPTLWNALPSNIKDLANFYTFKNKLKEHYLSN